MTRQYWNIMVPLVFNVTVFKCLNSVLFCIATHKYVEKTKKYVETINWFILIFERCTFASSYKYATFSFVGNMFIPAYRYSEDLILCRLIKLVILQALKLAAIQPMYLFCLKIQIKSMHELRLKLFLFMREKIEQLEYTVNFQPPLQPILKHSERRELWGVEKLFPQF